MNLMLPADATGGSFLSIFYCVQECLFLEHVIMTLLRLCFCLVSPGAAARPGAATVAGRPSCLLLMGLFGKNRCIANLTSYTVPSISLTRYVRT